jgi:hypothetical protein
MEYFAIALVSLGYQISFEYTRLVKTSPHNLAVLTRNSYVYIFSMIGGFACLMYSIYSATQFWGWLQGISLALLGFPLIWNVLFRITYGGDTLGFWVIAAWIVSPVGVYILVKI